MSKKQSIIIVTIFCVFIFGVGILTLLQPHEDFSESENRYLKKFPKLTLENIETDAYMKSIDEYLSDHIIFRKYWVQLKSLNELLLGKQENHNIYFAKDNYLIKKLENIDEVKLERNSNYLKKFSENNQNVFVGIIPTDEYILKDKLPLDATYENEKEIIQKIYENQKCTTLPILADLETHKDEYIYYKTDIHLTSLGAYYAANSILKGMNLPKLNLKDYEKNTVTKEYMGSNNSYSNAFWVTPDEIDTYINDDNLEIKSYQDNKLKESTLYHDEYLNKKDKYSYFLGGNNPLIIIKNKSINNAKKLLVVRDSYTSAIAPFLSERFSEVHLIDLRYNKNSIKEYIEKNNITDTLVLYGLATFLTDDNLVYINK